MTKWVMLALLALGALAGQAVGADPTVLAAADGTGLYVRAEPASVDAAAARGNLLGSAINTAGVVRATRAVTVAGRVRLVGPTAATGEIHLADARPTVRQPAPAAHQPTGLGAILARLLGLDT